ncbi:MAG: prolipoprotein diacylglyceryl transferase family protein [Chloroflexota bacterium]
MLIALDPVLLTIGALAVRWFGLLALVGLGLAVWLSLRALEREGLDRGVALDALAWALPAALVTARLVHVLGWWDYYLTHASELWQLSIDGLSLWGGLVGGGVIGFARLGSRCDPQTRRRILDVVAPNLALGIGVGRLGAFLDGHGQGLPSDLPWATQYANRLAATPDFGVPRQPAQLYDALVALTLWVALSRLPRRWSAGSRMALFLVLYSSSRLGLGMVRLDPSFLFGLQIEQLLAVLGLAFGVWYGLRPGLSSGRSRLAAAPGHVATTADRTKPTGSVPVQVILYMQADCHLCEEARAHLEQLGGRYPHTLEVVDISTQADLVRQYWDRIPVLNVGGREYAAPLALTVVERALQVAVAEQTPAPMPTTVEQTPAPMATTADQSPAPTPRAGRALR